MSIQRTIEYELKVPINVGQDGQLIECSKVILKAPTAKNRNECLFLKQAFLRALPKEVTSGATSSQDDDMPEGSDVIMFIGASSVDLKEIFDVAKRLFTNKVATLDGENMTSPIFDSIDMDDLEGLLGEYMINFILGSILSKQKKSS